MKLAYLFTFVTALTNVLGYTDISWFIVLFPSAFSIIIVVFLFLICLGAAMKD